MSDNKMHFWMATVKISFFTKADPEKRLSAMIGYRETNVVIETPIKRLNADSIDTIRQVSLMKCIEKYNLDPNSISDFLIQNISYLGLMSPKEYVGNTQPSRIEAK